MGMPRVQDPDLFLALLNRTSDVEEAKGWFVALGHFPSHKRLILEAAGRAIGRDRTVDDGILECLEVLLKAPELSPSDSRGLKADISAEIAKAKRRIKAELAA
jgi:hypothetical protein